MSISSVLDTLCAYLNTFASFLTTLQRLKNEYHSADGIDYTSVVYNLLTQPDVDPSQLGVASEILASRACHEMVLVAALVSLTVYHPGPEQDWTASITPVLKEILAQSHYGSKDPWRRGQLRPVVIDLHELHYMTTSKPHVYMGIYRPGETMILSLPGTNSKTDWLSNLHSSVTDLDLPNVQTRQRPQRVQVHAGFLYMALCLATHPSIIAYLNAGIKAGFTRLLLCGHSQAGAVVSLLALLLGGSTEHRRPNLETNVVTFGSAACIKHTSINVASCMSFVRCVRTRNSRRTSWQVDPVPLLDDAILSTKSTPSPASPSTQAESSQDDGAGTMSPMGTIFALLDGEQDDQDNHGSRLRQVLPGQLSALRKTMLLNFSADPHAMKGYCRALLQLYRAHVARGEEDDVVACINKQYLAMLETQVEEDSSDDELAALQLQS